MHIFVKAGQRSEITGSCRSNDTRKTTKNNSRRRDPLFSVYISIFFFFIPTQNFNVLLVLPRRLPIGRTGSTTPADNSLITVKRLLGKILCETNFFCATMIMSH